MCFVFVLGSWGLNPGLAQARRAPDTEPHCSLPCASDHCLWTSRPVSGACEPRQGHLLLPWYSLQCLPCSWPSHRAIQKSVPCCPGPCHCPHLSFLWHHLDPWADQSAQTPKPEPSLLTTKPPSHFPFFSAGDQTRASCLPGKHSTTELHHQPFYLC